MSAINYFKFITIMKSFISIYTLNVIDNILCNYKKRILRDFYDNFLDNKQKQQIDYFTFENQFIERKIDKPLIKFKTIDNEKCMAKIWINHYGGIQCSNKKNHGDYCLRHTTIQNYGRIDDIGNKINR